MDFARNIDGRRNKGWMAAGLLLASPALAADTRVYLSNQTKGAVKIVNCTAGGGAGRVALELFEPRGPAGGPAGVVDLKPDGAGAVLASGNTGSLSLEETPPADHESRFRLIWNGEVMGYFRYLVPAGGQAPRVEVEAQGLNPRADLQQPDPDILMFFGLTGPVGNGKGTEARASDAP